MRVGIYARVSTHDQQTLSMQLKQMKDYIKNRNWTLTIEVQEVGSGAKTRPKREELLKMDDDVRLTQSLFGNWIVSVEALPTSSPASMSSKNWELFLCPSPKP